LKSGPDRGFVFTIDALLSFIIAIGLSNALILFIDQDQSLSQEYLYQLSQDVMEVCSKQADFSSDCFGLLDNLGVHYSFFRNGAKEYGEDGTASVRIARHFSDDEIELRTWV
jgi:hypothetical protein